jgi:hypothetical protein
MRSLRFSSPLIRFSEQFDSSAAAVHMFILATNLGVPS